MSSLKPPRRGKRDLLARRHRFQVLEDRRLLAGDLQETILTTEQTDLLIRGLQQTADVFTAHEEVDRLLTFVRDDGSPVTIGELVDVGDEIKVDVIAPLESQLQTGGASSKSLVSLLQAQSGVSNVTGGLDETTGLIEFGFNYQDSFAASFDSIAWDHFQGIGIDISLNDTIEISGSTEYRIEFGLDTERGLRDEQSFFVRNSEASLEFESDSLGLDVDAIIGVLDAAASTMDFDSQTEIDIQIIDPSGEGVVTLAELESGDSGITDAVLVTSDLDAVIHPDPTDVSLLTLGEIQILGASTGDIEPTVSLANFESLMPFLQTSAGELLSGLLYLADWATLFADSEAFDTQIPHLAGNTFSDAVNPGEQLTTYLQQFLNADNTTTFSTINEFASEIGVAVSYNRFTKEIRLPISQAFTLDPLTAPAKVADFESPLSYLVSDQTLTHSVDSAVAFDLTINLAEDDELVTTQRFGVDGLTIGADIGTPQSAISGTGVFGTIGFDFADGSVSGTSSYLVNVVDPTSGSTKSTILNLYDGLSESETLVDGGEISFTSDSVLETSSLSIVDDLFATTPTETLTSTYAASFVPSIASANELLDTMRNLTMDDIYGAIEDAYDAVVGIGAVDKPVTELIPISIEKLADTGLQSAGYEGIQDVYAKVNEVHGEAIKLQDFAQDLIDEVVDDYIDVAQAVVQYGVDATEKAIDFGIQFIGTVTQATVTVATNVAQAAINAGQSFAQGLTFSGVGDAVDVDVTNELNIDVSIVPPTSPTSEPTVYLEPSSGIAFETYTNVPAGDPNPHTISGSLGALGLQLEDGSIVIADDVDNPDPTAPAVIHICPSFPIELDGMDPEISPNDLVVAGSGGIRADHEVYETSSSTQLPTRLSVEIPDFSLPNVNLQVPDFQVVFDALDLADELQGLPAALDEWLVTASDLFDRELFGIKLPVLGDALSAPANAIEKLRAKLAGAFDNLPNFNIENVRSTIENAIGIANAVVSIVNDSPDDVSFMIEWDETLVEESIAAKTSLGGDAFGADLNTEFIVKGELHMHVEIGLSKTLGLYVRTDNESIGIDFDIEMRRLNSEFNLEGRLGFLDVGILLQEVDGVTIGNNEVAQVFYVNYPVELIEPSGDNQLTISEIADGFSNPETVIDYDNTGLIGGTGAGPGEELVFRVVTQSGIPGTELMPKLNADFVIDWHFDGISVGGNLSGGLPDVRFENVQVDIGAFLTDTVGYFVDKTDFLIDPISPLLDVLTYEIDVLQNLYDDLDKLIVFFDFPEADLAISILKLAGIAADLIGTDSGIGKAITSVVHLTEALALINDLDTALDSTGSLLIDLGDVSLNRDAAGGFLPSYANVRQTNSLNELLNGTTLEDTIGNILDQFDENATDLPEPGLRFPVFEDPTSIFGWLLGFNEVDLVAYQLPSIDLNFPVDFSIPLLPPLVAVMGGSIGLQAQLGVGVDTFGFTEFEKSGNPLDFTKGFYFSDRENPDGTGLDVPQVTLRGEAFLGAGVGAPGASLVAEGGLSADVNFDFIDGDGDGKIRGDDFTSGDPCLGIFGGVDLFARLGVRTKLKDFLLPPASVNLGSFNTILTCGGDEIHPPSPIVAEVVGGVLRLFVGDDAHKRNILSDQENEAFSVSFAGGVYSVNAFGATQNFDIGTYDIDSIVADPGDGVDTITIDSSVLIPAELIGGDGFNFFTGGGGDDTLVGGDGENYFDGGDGSDELRAGVGLNVFDGGDGDDTLIGGVDVDELRGGDGNDVIVTIGGTDFVDGGDGDDTITGSSADDVIFGGRGDDTIDTRSGNDTVFGEAGDDTISGGGGNDDISGGPGNDDIDAQAGDDVVFGDGGDDTILAGSGSDFVAGGEGHDTITNQSGASEIDGQGGDDTITSGAAADLLFGGPGFDSIDGGDGDDEIHGENGVDELHGGGGNDSIFGGGSDDTITGGDQDDYIDGGSGNDELSGGNGDDEIFGRDGADTLHGDAGDDWLMGEGGNDVIFGHGSGSYHPINNRDRDTIDGGGGSDTLHGDHDADVINGRTGDDTIFGGGENDLIFGDEGHDTIHGDFGFDVVYGNRGNDHIFGDPGNDQLFGDEGDDTIEGGPGNDYIDGDSGDDHLLGNEDDDLIFGSTGKDLIEGNDDDDEIYGNQQDDLIYGDDGQDDVDGGSGNDTIRGGDDDDVLLGALGDDLILGNLGDDTIYGEAGRDVIKGYDGDDTLYGDEGADHIDGENGQDTIVGGDGPDYLRGGDGRDRIEGEGGNDELLGEADADELIGGPGRDYLWAGDGIGDLLDGGPGNDKIVGSGDGHDLSVPNAGIYFGDIIFGGPGNDHINALGGSDVIDSGMGNDFIIGGPHVDFITTGPVFDDKSEQDNDITYGGLGNDRIQTNFGSDEAYGGPGLDQISGAPLVNSPDGALPPPEFDMNDSIEVAGDWEELSGSASVDGFEGGLTKVGGFEQSVYSDDFGVYVAWVDVRDGNSEIYVARHVYDYGVWEQFSGSASGGGISNDPDQSRRPSIAVISGPKPESPTDDRIVVTWTKIDDQGQKTIETRSTQTSQFMPAWTHYGSIGGPPINADHSQLVAYPDDTVLLTYLRETDDNSELILNQFIDHSCFSGYLSGVTNSHLPINVSEDLMVDMPVVDYDLTVNGNAIGVGLLQDDGAMDQVSFHIASGVTHFDQGDLCPGVVPPPAPFMVSSPILGIPGSTLVESLGVFDVADEEGVAIAISHGNQILSQVGFTQDRPVFALINPSPEIQAAWQSRDDREDQIYGQNYDEKTVWFNKWQPWTSVGAATLSGTIGYAGLPAIDQIGDSFTLAWVDESVHKDGSADASIFVIDGTVPTSSSMVDEGTPSGAGISATGGVITELSLAQGPGPAVISWTELITGMPQVFLRTDLDEVDNPFVFTFDVDTLGDLPDIDPGDGSALDVNGNTSLRAAIQEANAIGGTDVSITINFSIPVGSLDPSGRFVIEPNSVLPTIEHPLTITSANAAALATSFPWVEISGGAVSGTSTDGLRITADDVIIDGIAISNFSGDGIEFIDAEDGVVQQSHVFDNGKNGIRIVNGVDITIRENAIYSNGNHGIQAVGANSEGVTLEDNLVGVQPVAGSHSANGNAAFGVHVVAPETSLFGNTISGNGRSGLVLSSTAQAHADGNFIGTSPNGQWAIPNGAFGVLVSATYNSQIGGPIGNVISGNSASGLSIATNSSNNTISNNRIGVAADGLAHLANNSTGISLRAGASNNIIEENLISGNSTTQLQIVASQTTGNVVRANQIGSNLFGVTLPGGSNGILIKSPGNTVGGPSTDDQNEITAPEGGTGILLSGSSAINNIISGNAISDTRNGIRITHDAHDNEVSSNIFVGLTDDAVQVTGTAGTRNRISANEMAENGFGIDLGANGANANDATDADSGPNLLQNSADLDDASQLDIGSGLTQITIDYFVDSNPANVEYPLTVEIFGASFAFGTPDETVQGTTLLSTTTYSVQDFISGSASHVFNINGGLAFTHLTATVTDADGNTSEFSFPVVVEDVAGPPQAARTNNNMPLDVNGDSVITALDALVAINAIGQRGEGDRIANHKPDTNGDGKTTAIDALRVINYLSRRKVKLQSDLLNEEPDDIDEAILAFDQALAELF